MRQPGIGSRGYAGAALFSTGRPGYPPPIRVLFATDSIQDPPTGVGRAAATWWDELRAAGVDLLALDHRGTAELRARFGDGMLVLPPRTRRFRTAFWHFDLLRRVARAGVPHDVLLLPSGYPCVLGTHPRLALFVHDLSALDPGLYRGGKRLWFRTFWKRSLRKARLLICVSEHTRREVLARVAGLDPARVVVVHNALSAEAAHALAAAGKRPASQRAHLLCVGTLETRKNVLRLLEAFARAARQGRVLPLVLAGRAGHGAAAIEARLSAPDLRSLVTWRKAPTEAELVALYGDARALLFPSLDEGFGVPLLEAMSAGAAVLTSDRSALPEIAGDAARLVDPEDEGALATAILELCRDDALVDRLATLGRARLRAFDPSTLARRLQGHLEALR